MVFSLFDTPKHERKVQLKNPNKVVIGSGTDIERAFQVGNFMNMLYDNIEAEHKGMTNSVVMHNLMVEIEMLIEHCIKNSNDGCAEQWYNHHKKQINTMVSLFVENLNLRYKLEKELPHLKRDVKKQTKEIIDSMKITAIGEYNKIVDEIVFTFPKYFEYIKH